MRRWLLSFRTAFRGGRLSSAADHGYLEGIAEFFEPNREIHLVASADDVLAVMALSDAELKTMAKSGARTGSDRAHRDGSGAGARSRSRKNPLGEAHEELAPPVPNLKG